MKKLIIISIILILAVALGILYFKGIIVIPEDKPNVSKLEEIKTEKIRVIKETVPPNEPYFPRHGSIPSEPSTELSFEPYVKWMDLNEQDYNPGNHTELEFVKPEIEEYAMNNNIDLKKNILIGTTGIMRFKSTKIGTPDDLREYWGMTEEDLSRKLESEYGIKLEKYGIRNVLSQDVKGDVYEFVVLSVTVPSEIYDVMFKAYSIKLLRRYR